MTVLSFQVPETTASRLDRLARQRSLSSSEMAALAIEEFVEREEWQLAEIEDAMREADGGDFASDDEAAAVISKYVNPQGSR